MTVHLPHLLLTPTLHRLPHLPCPAPCRDIKPENVMFAQPPSEAKDAPLTAAQLQAGRPRGGPGGQSKQAAAAAAAGYKMAVVKLVDLGMACLYDPAEPVTGESQGLGPEG